MSMLFCLDPSGSKVQTSRQLTPITKKTHFAWLAKFAIHNKMGSLLARSEFLNRSPRTPREQRIGSLGDHE